MNSTIGFSHAMRPSLLRHILVAMASCATTKDDLIWEKDNTHDFTVSFTPSTARRSLLPMGQSLNRRDFKTGSLLIRYFTSFIDLPANIQE
jgi:hypothetical protein